MKKYSDIDFLKIVPSISDTYIDCLPYNFILWQGILRQPELGYLVLCACEAAARVNQFLLVFDWIEIQIDRSTCK